MYARKYHRWRLRRADVSVLESWCDDDVWELDDGGIVLGRVTGEAEQYEPIQEEAIRDDSIVILPQRFKCTECGCEEYERKFGFTECAWCHGYGRVQKK